MDPYSLDHISLLLSRTSARSPSPYLAIGARPHSPPTGHTDTSAQRNAPSRASLRSRSPSLVLSKTCAHHPNTFPWRWSQKAPRCLQHSVL